LRVLVAPGETIELTVEAPDLAAAVSKAVRMLEHKGRRVLALEVADRPSEQKGGPSPPDSSTAAVANERRLSPE